LTREEVETVLPLFTKFSETRQLAAAIELRIRQGDMVAAKDLIERIMEASTFAVLASDWLEDPALLRMLHNRGIQGTDAPMGDAARIVELQKALDDERAHAQSLAREFAALSEKLADVRSAQERAAAAEAQLGELNKALSEERERAEVTAREYAGLAEKLARVQLAQERADIAMAQVAELQKALEDERQRGKSVSREYAALTEKLASVQSTQSIGVQTDATPSAPTRLPPQTSPPAEARIDLRITPAPVANPLVKRADALFRSGDVSGARLLLERAAEAGDSSAVLLLATTYDPRALAALGVIGVRGDAGKAEELYARAQALRSVQGALATEAK
jgi:tetratricopeptide (TPR) repeat protein